MNNLLTIILQIPVNVTPAQDIWNMGIMDAITSWKNNVAFTYADDAFGIAWYLCALLALFWCAARLYPVIAGDEKLSILPLMRPFVIAMVLWYWPYFVGAVSFPGQVLEEHTHGMFRNSYTTMRTVSLTRFEKYDKYSRDLMMMQAVAERGKDAEKNEAFQSSDIQKNVSWWSSITSGFNPMDSLLGAIAGMEMFIMTKIRWLFFQIFQYLALLFLNVVVCGVLFMQAAGLTIMAFIGPLAFAFSLVDAWKQSWAQWTARFISISLWSGLAYFICTIGTDIMTSALRAEIAYIDAAYDNGYWLMAAVASNTANDNILFVLLCLFVALGMIIIFPVSTWVVQTSGGSAVVKPFTIAASTAIGLGVAAATGGAGAAALAGGGASAGGQSVAPKS